MKQTSHVEKEPMQVPHSAGLALLQRLGATRFGTWVIKHVASPLDRWLYQATRGVQRQPEL